LELEDYEELFARRAIHTGTRTHDRTATTQPLYRRILGDAWHALPAPLRAMHECATTQVAAGRADVARGRNPLARLVAFAMRFPASAGGERWTRTFAGQSFVSFQSADQGAAAHLLRERFGPLNFDLALVIAGPKLCFVVRRWSLWGLPLPLCLAPRGDTYETVIDDRFHFNVEIRHRLVGLIVGYRGWLKICPLGFGNRGAQVADDGLFVEQSGRCSHVEISDRRHRYAAREHLRTVEADCHLTLHDRDHVRMYDRASNRG
jgi:hypothetical protein